MGSPEQRSLPRDSFEDGACVRAVRCSGAWALARHGRPAAKRKRTIESRERSNERLTRARRCRALVQEDVKLRVKRQPEVERGVGGVI